MDGERRLLTGGGRLHLGFASRVVLSKVTAATHPPRWMPAAMDASRLRGCSVERQFTDLTACLC